MGRESSVPRTPDATLLQGIPEGYEGEGEVWERCE